MNLFFIFFSMFHKMMEGFKGLKKEMKNHGDSLVITFSGDKDKIAALEKKMKAMKELCCGEEGESCCA